MGLDGAGLFCGVLKHFLDRGLDCPKVLAATHFHEVFRTDLFDVETVPVTFLHMQVMFTTNDGELIMDSAASVTRDGFDRSASQEEVRTVGPGEKITYLYKYSGNLSVMLRLIISLSAFRVAEGLSFDSHAAKCAEIFGVPRRVVERAQYVTCVWHITIIIQPPFCHPLKLENMSFSHLLATHELGQLLDEEMTEAETRDLEGAEMVCRKLLACKFDEVEGDGANFGVKMKLAEVLGRSDLDDSSR